MKQKIHFLLIILMTTIFAVSCEETPDEEGENNTNLTTGVKCNNLIITENTYSETEDLDQKVKDEFGSDYAIADWNDLEAISDLDSWISCMGLQDAQNFIVTKDGKFMYGSNRQYFVGYFTGGSAPSNWLVHASIDNKLFLGSWYGINKPILAKKE